jgi:hypothetical protein
MADFDDWIFAGSESACAHLEAEARAIASALKGAEDQLERALAFKKNIDAAYAAQQEVFREWDIFTNEYPWIELPEVY